MPDSPSVDSGLFERIRVAVAKTRFAGRVYAFGGWVRDITLGRRPRDIDLLVIGARGATRLAVTLSRVLGGTPVVIYSRSRTAQFTVGGVSVECRTLWRDGGVEPSALADEVMAMDFTANGLLWDLSDGTVLDPSGRARADLAARVIRTPRSPAETLSSDPRRLMRAVRLAAELGFTLDPELAGWLRAHAGEVLNTSIERIRDELLKLIAGADPARGLKLMDDAGLLSILLPEVAALKSEPAVFERTLETLGSMRPDLELRLAVLLHSIGRAGCDSDPSAAAELAARRLKSLCVQIALRHNVVALVRNQALLSDPPALLDVRRALHRLGGPAQVLILAEMSAAIAGPGREGLVRKVEALLPEAVAAGRPPRHRRKRKNRRRRNRPGRAKATGPEQ